MYEISLQEWQSYLNSISDPHILQTGEWGELKAGFGWEPVRMITGEIGAQILFRKLPFGFSVGYIPKLHLTSPSTTNIKSFLDELDSICLRHRAIFCKLEIDRWEGDKRSIFDDRWKISPYNIQPPRTLIIDLLRNEDEILAGMKQKCRYNIRLAEKKGVTVRAWDNLEGFHKMMLDTGGRDRFGVHALEYYRRSYRLFHQTENCELLVAEYEEKPLAALMVFAIDSRAWYVYGASYDDERNRMPTYLLQWEAMRWAKRKGCTNYDLWGVPDENETKLEADFETRHDGLWGVYRFKRGFGGELKRAEQAKDRVYNPWLYKLYLRRMAGGESI
jgi:lipid II:glycine glycyltransferase (peptidoglycan interpeptide bridge formation enzyme)